LSASEIREASLADGAATDFAELNPGYGKTMIALNELLRIVRADLPIIIGMHPPIWRGLTRLRQSDHVNGRRISALPARSAFQRGFKFPDRRITRSGLNLMSFAVVLRSNFSFFRLFLRPPSRDGQADPG
jgi:hypothetical protein